MAAATATPNNLEDLEVENLEDNDNDTPGKRGRKSFLLNVGKVFNTPEEAQNTPIVDSRTGDEVDNWRIYSLFKNEADQEAEKPCGYTWAQSSLLSKAYYADSKGIVTEVTFPGERGRKPATVDSELLKLCKVLFMEGMKDKMNAILAGFPDEKEHVEKQFDKWGKEMAEAK